MRLTPLILIMCGILIGVAVKQLCKRFPLPYTVTLFAIGLIIGTLSESDTFLGTTFLANGARRISAMDPDLILYVFLPILIFDAAYEMDLGIFRKTLVNASLLAGPGVVISMLLTASMVMGLYWLYNEYDPQIWTFALMFGGLISATDPVAVVALLQELGTSKKFSTLVDAESLLNDGTGLVCFMMFYAAFDGQGSIDHPFLYFIWVVIASFIIGYILYKIALWVVHKLGNEEILQNCVMLAGAYITFLTAQHLLDVSGVIALVVFGHFFANNGRPQLKPATNEFMEKFWSFFSFIANTLIFLIVGVIISYNIDITWMHIVNTILIYIGINIIRYIMIAILMPLLRRNGYGLTWKEACVLGWGGLRGALAMVMALMVNCNENIPQASRYNIVIYTAGIITMSLCINATTSKWLVKKLGLATQK